MHGWGAGPRSCSSSPCPALLPAQKLPAYVAPIEQFNLELLGARARPHLPCVRSYIQPDAALDLLGRLLCMDPSRRITAAEALQHPFFRMVRLFAGVGSAVCALPAPGICRARSPAPLLPGMLLVQPCVPKCLCRGQG